MKTLNHLVKSFFLFLLVVLVITACSKKGPEGPQGPQGIAGPAGNVAKVIYSDWFLPNNYDVSTGLGAVNLSYIQPAPGITQKILDSGVVLTYGSLSAYDGVHLPLRGIHYVGVEQLPITASYNLNGAEQIDTWSALAFVGNLQISLTNNNNLYTNSSSFDNVNSFRYIIISGGIPEGRMAGSPPDYSDYNAVCKYYGIPPR